MMATNKRRKWLRHLSADHSDQSSLGFPRQFAQPLDDVVAQAVDVGEREIGDVEADIIHERGLDP